MLTPFPTSVGFSNYRGCVASLKSRYTHYRWQFFQLNRLRSNIVKRPHTKRRLFNRESNAIIKFWKFPLISRRSRRRKLYAFFTSISGFGILRVSVGSGEWRLIGSRRRNFFSELQYNKPQDINKLRCKRPLSCFLYINFFDCIYAFKWPWYLSSCVLSATSPLA